MTTTSLPTFLPGTFSLIAGTRADYRALARFHYLPKPPATFAQIWTITYADPPPRCCQAPGSSPGSPFSRSPLGRTSSPPSSPSSTLHPPSSFSLSPRPIAIATLSYPTPRNRAREHFFHTAHLRYRDQILFANAHVRTLSRIIVHPQFRSLGLASLLTRHACANSPTRYTESLALMARAHPFFTRAGMTRIDPPGAAEDAPLYFIHDKGPPQGNDEFRSTNDEAMPNAE